MCASGGAISKASEGTYKARSASYEPEDVDPPSSTAARALSRPSNQEAIQLEEPDTTASEDVSSPRKYVNKGKTPKFWSRHITLRVPNAQSRDHLANERTFLAYIRTGQAFSMTGIAIAQLMRLQDSASSDQRFGAFAVGIPMSVVFQLMAAVVTLIGAARFWQMQTKIALGFASTGGWKVMSIGGLATLVSVSLFILVITAFAL